MTCGSHLTRMQAHMCHFILTPTSSPGNTGADGPRTASTTHSSLRIMMACLRAADSIPPELVCPGLTAAGVVLSVLSQLLLSIDQFSAPHVVRRKRTPLSYRAINVSGLSAAASSFCCSWHADPVCACLHCLCASACALCWWTTAAKCHALGTSPVGCRHPGSDSGSLQPCRSLADESSPTAIRYYSSHFLFSSFIA